MVDRREIIKILAFLAALYPRFELTEASIDAYSLILADIPADLLEAAAKDLGSRATFFPAAAELRRAAYDLIERSQQMPTAYEAWRQVKSQFAGRREELHPLAVQAISSLGGLRAFGQSQVDDEPSWRARLIAAYEIMAERQRRD